MMIISDDATEKWNEISQEGWLKLTPLGFILALWLPKVQKNLLNTKDIARKMLIGGTSIIKE